MVAVMVQEKGKARIVVDVSFYWTNCLVGRDINKRMFILVIFHKTYINVILKILFYKQLIHSPLAPA